MEGRTPLLLSSKWLYEQRAVIDFGSGQAYLPHVSPEVIQLEGPDLSPPVAGDGLRWECGGQRGDYPGSRCGWTTTEGMCPSAGC